MPDTTDLRPKRKRFALRNIDAAERAGLGLDLVRLARKAFAAAADGRLDLKEGIDLGLGILDLAEEVVDAGTD